MNGLYLTRGGYMAGCQSFIELFYPFGGLSRSIPSLPYAIGRSLKLPINRIIAFPVLDRISPQAYAMQISTFPPLALVPIVAP